MSGGHFDYQQYRIQDMIGEIEELINSNDNNEKDQFGDRLGRGYPPDIIQKFKESIPVLQKAAAMVQRIDWLVSGDDGEESFRERWIETVDSI
jgi:hypothetical protein